MASQNHHGAELNGKDVITPTPFDAHEQVVRNTHTHNATTGYAAGEFTQQEYPKYLGDVDGVPVVVNNADEEKAYKAKAKKAWGNREQ